MDIEVNLIRRCKNYERAAFDTLLKKYEGYLYSICYGFTQQREESLDIMQEVYIKLFRSISKFDEKRPFLPWLKRITVNTCINYHRDKKTINQVSINGNTRGELALVNSLASSDNTEENVIFWDTRETIARCLQGLPDNYRMAITLRYLENMSYDEIASTLKQPIGTVKNSIHRARCLLKKNLEEYGVLEV
ncbi:RNA polymerase sigma factor [Candidatus Contubernalis alkaliaceticus]|uniref:RNA polymerase sigma factor n=1 Tax=Candidatus Contubernalis alkaliaceticus TaxID=338645 RepID=UPI001F4C3409|nr:RNA polymerase sigma factor [Candidatus Contubernalis alkalaceticus]UNC92914.1 RNA polymerase sigma factor [Candidatus Contubernalis alkalaceticus]